MAMYEVIWQMKMRKVVVGVGSKQEAMERIEECDPVEDGEYVIDSFEIVKAEKL